MATSTIQQEQDDQADAGESSSSSRSLESLVRCDLCDRVFATARGCGQHKKRAHPDAANQLISTERVKARWTVEETRRLARAELLLRSLVPGISNVNQELRVKFPTRTLEAIKSHRRQPIYLQTLQEMERESVEVTGDDLVHEAGGGVPALPMWPEAVLSRF